MIKHIDVSIIPLSEEELEAITAIPLVEPCVERPELCTSTCLNCNTPHE